MKFDKVNHIAYVMHSVNNPGNFQKALWFEQLFGEIISDCVCNKLTFNDYVNNNEYINVADLAQDFERDYMSGIDYTINNNGINSKILYNINKSFHLKSSDIRHIKEGNLNYFSVIDKNSRELYLIPAQECIKHIDSKGDVKLSDDIEHIINIHIPDKMIEFYNKGYQYYLNGNIEKMKDTFEKLTGYTIEEIGYPIA